MDIWIGEEIKKRKKKSNKRTNGVDLRKRIINAFELFPMGKEDEG